MKEKEIEEMDKEMEQHRQTRLASEQADVEQFLAFAAKTQPEMTEEERQWHVLCVKNGSRV